MSHLHQSLEETSLPLPGTTGFAELTAEDQAWFERVRVWLGVGLTSISPTRILTHPLMGELRNNPEDWRQMVKFYRGCPVIFDMALASITGERVRGKTAAERQAAWSKKVDKLASRHQKAAE